MISFPSVTWESSPTRHGVTASFIELIYIQVMNVPNVVFVITLVIYILYKNSENYFDSAKSVHEMDFLLHNQILILSS